MGASGFLKRFLNVTIIMNIHLCKIESIYIQKKTCNKYLSERFWEKTQKGNRKIKKVFQSKE